MPSQITGERLTGLLRPASVALIGASDKSAFSALAYGNLARFGHGERTYLVNRRGVVTHGRPTVTSCQEIDGPVDLAFVLVPRAGVPDALSDAAAAGIRNAVVLAAGYGETGEAGRAAQAELVAHAESLDMILLGPNNLGFANIAHGIPALALPGVPPHSGPVALLSQSGASSSAMLDFATMTDVGLSYMVTLGNEAMITAGHVLDFLVDDPGTRAIAIFLEAVREPEVFRRAARRAAEAGKAVVALKAGSSALSARTAQAHTGALVGDDRVIDAVFGDLGVIRVDSIEDLLITAGAVAALGRLERPGIGIVSISGGACDIAADRAADLGADLPELTPATTEALAEIGPDFGSAQNPFDVTGAAVLDPTIFTRSIRVLSRDPAVGVVGVVNVLPWIDDGGPYLGQPLVDAIGAGMRDAGCPVVYINQVMQPITDRTRAVMAHGGVDYVIPGLRQAIVALHHLAWWSEATRSASGGAGGERVADTGRGAGGEQGEGRERCGSRGGPGRRGRWSEDAARRLLADAGVPVVPAQLVTCADDAAAAAAEFGGGPVCVQAVSADIPHKTDIGGVRLDVPADPDAVRDAYTAVTSAAAHAGGAAAGGVSAKEGIEGVLISPMRRGGVELLVGVVRDPQWGPMLAVALGGVFVEALDDSVLAPLPVTAARVRRMLDGLRGRAVLDGFRGGAPADLDAVAAVIARVGDLAVSLGDELESLEINPLRVDGATVEALDTAVSWAG